MPGGTGYETRGRLRHEFLATGARVLNVMDLILWIIAVVLVVAGILALFRRQLLWGIVLIIVGLLVGPGGVSIFH
jgi:hypothetical protein